MSKVTHKIISGLLSLIIFFNVIFITQKSIIYKQTYPQTELTFKNRTKVLKTTTKWDKYNYVSDG